VTIGIFAKLARKDPTFRKVLYELVAQRIRSRALDPGEAQVIAAWFDRLARGEKAARVFPEKKKIGRPSRARKSGHDEVDIAFIAKTMIAAGIPPRDVWRALGKAEELKPASVRNIYLKHKKTLA
jgi:hypothetical protein